jgi:hypothetical protein
LPRVNAFILWTEGKKEGKTREWTDARIQATFPPSLASRIIEGYEIDPGRSIGRYVVLARKAGPNGSPAGE